MGLEVREVERVISAHSAERAQEVRHTDRAQEAVPEVGQLQPPFQLQGVGPPGEKRALGALISWTDTESWALGKTKRFSPWLCCLWWQCYLFIMDLISPLV